MSHTVVVVLLLIGFSSFFVNCNDDTKRVQELLHTHFRCHAPKEVVVYLESLPAYSYDPGVEWVPRGVVLKQCGDFSGYCTSSPTKCAAVSVQNFSSPFLKIDRIHNKITYTKVELTNHTQCGCNK